ncbi:MAG: T9SS type A sorting domain-containing protein, partial [Bacteroidota bacterium]
IFPQPVHDILTIDIRNFSGKGWLYIINELGQTVISKEIDFEKKSLRRIEMSNYAAGIYTVIVQGLEQTEIVRVVKQ